MLWLENSPTSTMQANRLTKIKVTLATWTYKMIKHRKDHCHTNIWSKRQGGRERKRSNSFYLFKTTLHHQLCWKQFFLCYTVCIKIYWTNSQQSKYQVKSMECHLAGVDTNPYFKVCLCNPCSNNITFPLKFTHSLLSTKGCLPAVPVKRKLL